MLTGRSLSRCETDHSFIPSGGGRMDWKNDLPTVTGIDKVVAEMARKLLEKPVIFQNPFCDETIFIDRLKAYRTWTDYVMEVERGIVAEKLSLTVWAKIKKF